MATPDLAPPPLRTVVTQKDGTSSPVWERWFQQLWDWVKAIKEQLEDASGTVTDSLNDTTRALYYQLASQSIPNNSTSVINFNTADIAHANVTTGAAWKFTASKAGVYQLSAGATLPFPNVAGIGILILAKNGVELQTIARIQGAVGSSCITGSTLIQLAAGDYIDIRLFQNSGSAQALESGRQSWVAINMLPGA